MGATTASHRRRAVAMALTVVVWLAGTSTAHADPPTPTDYRSEVVGIEPPVDTVTASIVGGDSFLQLRVAPGTTVVVPGYQDEPFLEFAPDGTVRENRTSPTWFLNQTRYGADVPEGIDADTPPTWVEVGDQGVYAWHDHRTHPMSPDPPADAARGEQILRSVIPIVVDGTPAEVTVVSTWEPRPSVVPVIVGLLAGAALAAWILLRRRTSVLLPVAAVLSGAALVLGVVQYRSVPSETGPSSLSWMLPLVAALAVAAAAAFHRRLGWLPTAALLALAGVQLSLWGWNRRTVVVRAVLPTDAPWWLDRLVTTTVLVAAPALVVAALWPVVTALRTPAARPTT